jgi:hypothetical protein
MGVIDRGYPLPDWFTVYTPTFEGCNLQGG